MPTIKIALIKPASDAVQAAHHKLRDLNAEINALQREGADKASIARIESAMGNARQDYEVALFNLSVKVHTEIEQAVAE